MATGPAVRESKPGLLTDFDVRLSTIEDDIIRRDERQPMRRPTPGASLDVRGRRPAWPAAVCLRVRPRVDGVTPSSPAHASRREEVGSTMVAAAGTGQAMAAFDGSRNVRLPTARDRSALQQRRLYPTPYSYVGRHAISGNSRRTFGT